jgi:hypothetical protein
MIAEMSRQTIKIRRLEIDEEFGALAEQEIELRYQMLAIEAKGAALNRELAQLALKEATLPPPPAARPAARE